MEPQYLDDLCALNEDGSDYIRLLRVQISASRPKEAPLCELRTFSLRHAPRYSALSCSRQPEFSIVNIDVRGSVKGSFPISDDLRSAMKAIHRHRYRRSDWLWIDAICINQFSNDEKSDQVPRMRAIYEDAYAGSIWLGNAVTREQADYVEPEQGTCLVHAEDEGELTLGRILDGKGTCDSNLALTREKVMQLLELTERHRLCWCRAWVIQEMALRTRLYVCVGLHLMRWDQLVNASHNWLSYSYHDESIPDEYMLKIESESNGRAPSTALISWSYSVWGQNLMLPTPGTMLYAEVTAKLIDKYQTMDVIASSLWHGNEKSQTWLPSWVANFSSGSYDHTEKKPLLAAEVSVRGYTKNGARAGGKTRPSASNVENALKLRLEAVFLNRVVETLEPDEETSEENCRPTNEIEENDVDDCDPHVSQQLHSWLSAATRLLRSSSARTSPLPDPRHALQRSIDIVRGLTRADVSPAFYKDEYYCSTVANNNVLDDILRNIESLNDELVREQLSSKHVEYERFTLDIDRSADDTLFATESEFVGWARRGLRKSWCKPEPLIDTSVRNDDIVVVPRGASLPWVLRETDSEGEYKLIADCGVYGIMSGELMALVESGKLQTERYALV